MSFDGLRQLVSNEDRLLLEGFNSERKERVSRSRIMDGISWISGLFSYQGMVNYRLPTNGWTSVLPSIPYPNWNLGLNVVSDITRFFNDFWYRPGIEDVLKSVDPNSEEFKEYARKFTLANRINYVSWAAAGIDHLTAIVYVVLMLNGKIDPARHRLMANINQGSKITKYVTRAIADYLRPEPIPARSMTNRFSQNMRDHIDELETKFDQIQERNAVLNVKINNARDSDRYIEPIDDSFNY